ncbi:toxin-antitoxin system YwqK family antitoxin [Portibacter marinus]|uniref:toxin-antitoxin system YwqK family antitoxin n=1 Tax=Portibacter marinus TaxID=2898660 RepID=UPI001F15F3AB|nr:toxin-antitoxin system YwqK family antitoxin [Portibacter marinus]
MRYLTFILLVLMLQSCGRRLDEVEIRNAKGDVVERFYLNQDSLRFGTYTSFNEQGAVFEESQYKNGELHGIRKIYYPDGAVEIEENYKKGRMEGPYLTYYKNGQVNLEAQYVDGKMEGTVKRYYDSGELMEEVTFMANEENGPFKEYFKNGQVKWEGQYKDGDNEFGLIKSYNEKGELVKKMECGKYQGEYICQTIWTIEEGDKALVLEYED